MKGKRSSFMTDQILSTPALLSARYLGRRRGVRYEARFACGHVASGVFPHAKLSTSRDTISHWIFGLHPESECCSRQCRERVEQR
jgi:hypothetical protein